MRSIGAFWRASASPVCHAGAMPGHQARCRCGVSPPLRKIGCPCEIAERLPRKDLAGGPAACDGQCFSMNVATVRRNTTLSRTGVLSEFSFRSFEQELFSRRVCETRSSVIPWLPMVDFFKFWNAHRRGARALSDLPCIISCLVQSS